LVLQFGNFVGNIFTMQEVIGKLKTALQTATYHSNFDITRCTLVHKQRSFDPANGRLSCRALPRILLGFLMFLRSFRKFFPINFSILTSSSFSKIIPKCIVFFWHSYFTW